MSNSFRLDGKVALVTGASYGIGFAIANAMAEAGADYREILTHYYTGVTVEAWAADFTNHDPA